VPAGPTPLEFHASVRVPELAAAARFYTWLLGVGPKEWTHRYATFVSEALRTNFVLLVSDGQDLHHDTLYHLGVDVGTRAAVIDAAAPRRSRGHGRFRSRRAPPGAARRCTSCGSPIQAATSSRSTRA
jgi:catechol 2,3-dioxygenase-like lactoylglutathione lyase family enzyme